MSEAAGSSSSASSAPRARGKSRGGLGKYLRSRGRGHGRGRPAEFTQRLVLEDEAPIADEEEAAAVQAEIEQKYSRRRLGTNADRYVEPEPELDSDGEPILEPEVDLSEFLERQRISDAPEPSEMSATQDVVDDEDVDHSLAHISSGPAKPAISRKGQTHKIQWDAELDDLQREKASAEAIWDLKSRFRAKSDKLRKAAPTPARARQPDSASSAVEAPPLPLPDGSLPPSKVPKEEMQDFLDDLLG